MLKVKMLDDPWTDGETKNILYQNPNFSFNTGVTILLGRNGAGKTTLLKGIQDHCKTNCIPCFYYDNYTQGGSTAKSEYGFLGDFDSLCNTIFHSEGEQLYYNFCKQVSKIGGFCKKHENDKVLVICLDALDSGLDCEGIHQLLDCFNLIISDNKDKEVYIIIAANNYGLIRNQTCLDVKTGKTKIFNTYEDFENFILNIYKEERNK